MNPTCRLQDASGASVRLIKQAISIKGIGLEDPAISGQMEPRMLTLAIARVIVHRGRRRCSTEWLVVANIDPTSAGVGLAFRQNRNGRVITMQALRGQDMGSKPLAQRRQRRASRTHGIGHGREADRHTFTRIALRLAVERLMLTKFLEQNHRQQVRPCPPPGDHMERRGCLADFLAIPASEFL